MKPRDERVERHIRFTRFCLFLTQVINKLYPRLYELFSSDFFPFQFDICSGGMNECSDDGQRKPNSTLITEGKALIEL